MSISTPFIRRPVGTSLLMAALVLVGIAAYPLLPVAPLPRVDFPTILVNAQVPRRQSGDDGGTVAQPLERQFAQIAGVSQMTSVSVLGQSQITIQFDLDRNIDAAAGDVQAEINAASGQLPKNLPSAPTYLEGQPVGQPDPDPVGPVRRGAADPGGRLRRQHPVAADLADRRGGAGVSSAASRSARFGCRSIPAKLAAMGMTLEDVRMALVNATANAPKGMIDSRAPQYHALCQRPAHQGRQSTTTSSWRTATARRCACAISAGRSMAPENNSWPAGRTASAASSCWCSSSPAPT